MVKIIFQCVLNAKGMRMEKKSGPPTWTLSLPYTRSILAQIEFEGFDAFIGVDPSIEKIVTNNLETVFCDVTGGSSNDSPFRDRVDGQRGAGFRGAPAQHPPLLFSPPLPSHDRLPQQRQDGLTDPVPECRSAMFES
uniref:Uncharacterized protein n=1 Tax=Alexandrium monilatum TaxID=311494 RepID=A0A7S4V5E8_9DINO